MTVDVADGEDVPDVGAQVLIDGDCAPSGVDPRPFQVQLADAGGPADREEHGVGDRMAGGRAAAVIDADGRPLRAESLDDGVCGHGHAPAAERTAEFGRDTGVGARDEDVAGLEYGDGGAEVSED